MFQLMSGSGIWAGCWGPVRSATYAVGARLKYSGIIGTSSLKIRRHKIKERYGPDLDALYERG